MANENTNRLAGEVSPYLVQHADNPVAWYPWGKAAFAAARSTGKPILLSIGYSACHWCHVMAHESFEDESTAAVMNDLFVNIKVDREERPDVDHLYMSALHALGQQGGWPLTMFLRPDGQPFWGGTYFPKTARYGQPAFTDVLRSVRRAFDEKPDDVANNAAAIIDAISPTANSGGAMVDLPWLNAVAARIAPHLDPIDGGLAKAPKFPNPPILEFLWRAADRTGNESIRQLVVTAFERMSRGGIFDHIGGGFARYSVDSRWLVPHFEKMLYDNAQLLPLLALAARHTQSDLLRNACESTVGWLERDMLTDGGAFAASEDADSLTPDGHAEEGAFYTFTPAEIQAALGAGASTFNAAYDITDDGNFEGRSIPNRLADRGLADSAVETHRAARATLLTIRAARPRPHRDDKILADWNGLMIVGLVRAAEILDHPHWIDIATAAYERVIHRLDRTDGLAHAWRAGKHTTPGFAADYAAMALAAIALFEATGIQTYLDTARRYADDLLDRYTTGSGVLAMTTREATDLPHRPSPTQDDATPNANGIAAEVLIRLFGVTGDIHWLTAADDLISACSQALRANPFGHASLMNAIDLRLRRADIVVSAPGGDLLLRAAMSVPYPNRTLVRASGEHPQATVCVDGRCSLPIAYPEQLLERVRADIAAATA